MNRLALNYNGQGKYAQAEARHSQVLKIERRVLCPENPNTMAALRNLGYDCERQGKYAQAEEIDSQSLEVHRRVSGPEHPSTLIPMTNLAIVYDEQGKFAQAEPLFRQIVDIQRRVLGPSIPTHWNPCATWLNFSAILASTRKLRRYAARPWRSGAACWARRVRQRSHPMHDLADTYYVQGKYAQAEPVFKQVLEAGRRVMGPEDPVTLNTLSGLAAGMKIKWPSNSCWGTGRHTIDDHIPDADC
jgi:non-specific serine/threonine protein kinase/serine/threonine-protein kinase